MDCGGFCIACGKRLKTLEGQKPMAYHIKCFNELIGDFNKFDKIAYMNSNASVVKHVIEFKYL